MKWIEVVTITMAALMGGCGGSQSDGVTSVDSLDGGEARQHIETSYGSDTVISWPVTPWDADVSQEGGANEQTKDNSSGKVKLGPYDEGYDDGYEDGYEDGIRERGYDYDYDNFSFYKSKRERREYRRGYEEGYDDGYEDGEAAREEGVEEY